MPSLKDYLHHRLTRGYRRLVRSLEGIPEDEARRGGNPSWRRYRFGTGLDGSIAGIVYHLAAWKHVAADGLEGGTFPDAEAVLPHGFGWTGLLDWLESGNARLLRALEELKPEDLDRTIVWEGHSMPVHELYSHMIEHDQYHTGQVYLLRQQMGHTFTE